MCPVGGGTPAVSADAARRHAGQTTREDHEIPAAAQKCAGKHAGASGAAGRQSHGEGLTLRNCLSPSGRRCSPSSFLFAPLQLSSVKRFLESINDYIRLRDDELALSISAQRLEGYEVEGLNEDIDKVRRKPFWSFIVSLTVCTVLCVLLLVRILFIVLCKFLGCIRSSFIYFLSFSIINWPTFSFLAILTTNSKPSY